MEEYCGEVLGKETIHYDELHSTALTFLKQLNLPTIHPGCSNGSIMVMPEVIPYPNNYNNVISNIITFAWQAFPALLAMSELWLRLFAFVIAPLSIAYLSSNLLLTTTSNRMTQTKIKPTTKSHGITLAMIILGMASAIVILTDSQYVLTYGRFYGAGLFLLLSSFGIMNASRMKQQQQHHQTNVYFCIVLSVILTIYLFLHSDSTVTEDNIYGHPGIDIPTIQEGTYVSKKNALMSKVVSIWPQQTRVYTNQETPYLPTGDAKTGIPFLVNPMPQNLQFHRVWVSIPKEPEAVALEIAFPPSGIHSKDKTVYLILHGLNGGTQEAYVRDFVQRRTNEGHTCIIMIARGLMDTPIVGWNVFKGSRITDVDASARAIRKALNRHQSLAGVGYSMGAIILSNYVARSGKKCQLDMAMAVSGGLDMREQLNFDRSKRLWQPMLAKELRDKFIIGKLDPLYRHRLSAEQYLHLMRASSIHEIDKHAVVAYNGYDDLLHYYTDMSAMGDTTQFQRKKNNNNNENNNTDNVGRIANVAIPFCVLHALDDPLVTWRTMGHDPESLVNTGSGYLMMVLTKAGGHVGWPLGTYAYTHIRLCI